MVKDCYSPDFQLFTNYCLLHVYNVGHVNVTLDSFWCVSHRVSNNCGMLVCCSQLCDELATFTPLYPAFAQCQVGLAPAPFATRCRDRAVENALIVCYIFAICCCFFCVNKQRWNRVQPCCSKIAHLLCKKGSSPWKPWHPRLILKRGHLNLL